MSLNCVNELHAFQVTRILVGNLMNLMEEVETCQFVVNTSAGGGVVVEPRFRNAPGIELFRRIQNPGLGSLFSEAFNMSTVSVRSVISKSESSHCLRVSLQVQMASSNSRSNSLIVSRQSNSSCTWI